MLFHSSFNCPTKQQLYQYQHCNSNIGNSNQCDDVNSSRCHLLCICTNHHVLDTILLCLHISTSAVAAAKPSVAATCAMKTGKGGTCRAVERPTPTSHKGKSTFLIIKLRTLADEKLLFQAQYFSPAQSRKVQFRSNSLGVKDLSPYFSSWVCSWITARVLSFSKFHPASKFNLDHLQFRSFFVRGTKTIQCGSFYFYTIVISFKKREYAVFLITFCIHKTSFELSILLIITEGNPPLLS